MDFWSWFTEAQNNPSLVELGSGMWAEMRIYSSSKGHMGYTGVHTET